MELEKRISSELLKLQIPTATLVVAPDETHLVFPAIDIEHKNRPPTGNLNTDPDGPQVLSVTVHRIPDEQARRQAFGNAGVERLSLVLPAGPFADLLKLVEGLRLKSGNEEAVTLALDAAIGADGSVTELSQNGSKIEIKLSSDTVDRSQEPAPRAGETGRQ